MTELLLKIGISNLVLSLAIALVAYAVQTTGSRPRLAYLLWLLVLVKLVTPPLFTVPMVEVPGPAPVAAAPVGEVAGSGSVAAAEASLPESPAPATAVGSSPAWFNWARLTMLWLLGSACVLAWSLLRILRFHRLLRAAAGPAPPELERVAAGIAKRLLLRKTPVILTTSASVSPLVWWIGGRVRVILPAALVREMSEEEIHWVVAHELAHVKRRDHLVRWLEWLAVVTFWWNPVAWLARRNLRVNEEICCDALVLESLKPDRRVYGNSLLTAVELLAFPALRAPAMASEVNSGGFLERRFKMIVSARPLRATPRWLTALLLIGAVAILPLGLARAGEPDYEAVAKRLEEAVRAGELSTEQAAGMMGELARAGFVERMATGGRKRGPASSQMAAVKEKIWAAVKAGEITEKDAKLKWEAYLKSLKTPRRAKAPGSGERKTPSREEMGEVKEKIWAAVKTGAMTEEQAKARWNAYLEKVRGARPEARGGERGERRVSREEYRKIEADLRRAVAEGRISVEDAKARLAGLRKTAVGEGEGRPERREGRERRR